MRAPAVTTIDFESLPIKPRPRYPPVPVGVSIKRPCDKKIAYYAWGHPTKNNCTLAQGRRMLQQAWSGEWPLLFQNAKFDVDVAVTHLDMKMPSWDRIHDTLYLLFLENPHARTFSLKPSAEEYLGMPPEERDAVEDWLKLHMPDIREKDDKGKLLPWAAYIGYAPGDLVGKYANGDVLRTIKLFQLLYPRIVDRGMLKAYDRERRLMPVLLRNEQEGIRVDLNKLEQDAATLKAGIERADQWLRKALKSPDLNVDAPEQIAEAFTRMGVVDEESWIITKSGKRSTSKKNMTSDIINNKRVAQVYTWRGKASTCDGTFMTPWLLMAHRTSGRIHTHWNQVKSERGGAATGRQSSTPNFQNIPKGLDGGDFIHPVFANLPPLPLMRSYLLPDGKNDVWLHRDYSQQEIRVLAHFEDGELLQKFHENYAAMKAGTLTKEDRLDIHGIVHKALLAAKLGLTFSRTQVKGVVFQIIYGGGIPAICNVLKCDANTAKKVIAVLLEALPGYADLNAMVKAEGKAGNPIVTWGGREYYTEPPRYDERFKRHMTYEYKLLNYLIQGSSAECTKEAIIRYDEHPKREARLLLSVHDEMNSSSPGKRWKIEDEILRECMESVEFDVPMLTDGSYGPRWSDQKDVTA